LSWFVYNVEEWQIHFASLFVNQLASFLPKENRVVS